MTLASKADVLREVANVASTGEFDDQVVLRSGKRGLKAGKRRFKGETVPPKAAVACNVSGTYAETEGNRTRAFAFYGNVSVPVQFERTVDNNCVEQFVSESSTFRYTYNGTFEYGESETDGAGTSYAYEEDDGTYTESETRNNVVVFRASEVDKGKAEYRQRSSGVDLRALESVDYSETDNGQNFALSLQLGEGSTPFAATLAGNSLALDGVLRYSTTAPGCGGGRVVLKTAAGMPLTQAEGGFINGGTLNIQSGSQSAVVTYNNDGSATYQIAGGASGTLSRSEIEAATDDACLDY